jgi:hypothetical protein
MAKVLQLRVHVEALIALVNVLRIEDGIVRR